MPHFLVDAVGGLVMQVEPSEPFGAYLQEYRDLGDEFHATMYFFGFLQHEEEEHAPEFQQGIQSQL